MDLKKKKKLNKITEREKSEIPGEAFSSCRLAPATSLHRAAWAGPRTLQRPCPIGNNPASAGSGRDELASFPSYFVATKIMSEVWNRTSCKILLLLANAPECLRVRVAVTS